MTRHTCSCWLGAVLGLFAIGSATIVDGADAERPNVVLIISDDQAWTDYSFLGHDVIETPRLDRLARESLTFTRGYVPTSLCRPSLATIMTGLYPHQHGITGNDPPAFGMLGAEIDQSPGESPRSRFYGREDYQDQIEAFHKQHIDQLDTLAKMLGRHGYRSHQSGKWWEGSFQRAGFTAGMTHGDPSRGGRHGDQGLTIGRQGLSPVMQFLDSSIKDKAPYFIYYAPFLPHTPHNPPERLLEKYRGQAESLPIAKYYAMCEWFDETVGQLLDGLEDRQQLDNTIVIYVCDNGWINRNDRSGYAARSKRSPYEGGIRTPIMIRFPKVVSPRINTTDLASSIDIVPTILSLCGLETPKALPGVNLTDQDAVAERDAIFGAIFEHDMPASDDPGAGLISRWVIAGDEKLIVPNRDRFPESPLELYDLVNDPHEFKDRAPEKAGRVDALEERLNRWWHPVPKP